MPQRIAESRAQLVAESTGRAGRYRIRLIDAGWGSSGFYSESVLTEAAQARVFPAGLHMYADHPHGDGSGLDENGNRSVRDLWGVLATDATLVDGALVAEARVFAPYRPLVDDMYSEIGLSIRALGSFEMGEADGREGRIITSLDEARSVDFVSAAGRGGQILEVLESAAARWLDEATANDVRDALSTAISDAYRVADTTWAYVRDFDPAAGLVYFEVSGETSGTYQQGYELGSDGTASLTGQRIEVTVRTTYVPVTPAGQSTTTTESEEDTMPQIEEARLRQLEADAGRVQTLESERQSALQRAETAERRLAEADARTAARPIVAEVFAGHQLPSATHARVVEAVVAAAPLTEAGGLDETGLRTAATAARTAAETEIAEALAAAGHGRVRGFGGSDSTEVSEADIDKAVAATFGRTVKES